jgi:vitamin B12 transporter
MRRLAYILSLLSFSILVNAQEEWHYLDMVEISGGKNTKRNQDTVVQHAIQLGALSQNIQQANGVYIRNYGPSNIASLSIRGTEPAQNQVLYRDLNVNSVFLGQSDLSIFNTAAGNFSMQKGIGTLSKNSGALGGMLNFDFIPRFSSNQNQSITALLEGGSFQTYRAQVKSEFVSERFYNSTSISYDRSENNFKYKDISQANSPEKKQENGAYQRLNFTQDFAIKFKKGQAIEFGGAYFFMDREVPPALLSSNQNESQTDHLGVANVQYKMTKSKHALRIASYYKYQYLKYNNEQAGLSAVTKGNTALDLIEYKFAIRPHLIFKSKIENQADWVNNPQIDGLQFRNRFSMVADLKHKVNNYFNWSTVLREELYTDFVSPFLFNLNAEIFPLGKSHFSINFSGGRNFRYPTINDLYWIPGGNPDLRPEHSWGGEMGSDYLLKKDKWQLRFQQDIYFYKISNQIRWLPSDANYFQAQNIASVITWGYEPQLSFNYTPNKSWILKAQLFYHLNNSYETASMWQSIYVPKHQLKSVLVLDFKGYYTEFIQEWSSVRYTSRDNSTSLDAYQLFNLSVGKKLDFDKHQLVLQVRAENLGNASYVLYAGRPMPGRAFYATVKYRWK